MTTVVVLVATLHCFYWFYYKRPAQKIVIQKLPKDLPSVSPRPLDSPSLTACEDMMEMPGFYKKY